MDSLQVRTGQVSLRILDDNGDERGIFTFNPTDIESTKRIIGLREVITQKQEEYIEADKEMKTAEERINLLSEIVNDLRDTVDKCFGEGTSQTVFGDAHSLSMFNDFIEGITPYYQKASDQRTAKYKKPTKK